MLLMNCGLNAPRYADTVRKYIKSIEVFDTCKNIVSLFCEHFRRGFVNNAINFNEA
jgi:hypothetical protein